MRLSEQIKVLEEEIEELKRSNGLLRARVNVLIEERDHYKQCCKMVIPNQVYTHKKRGNTTVKFLDGSQQTVRRRKGEKDCLETAIAYCVLKQLLPTADLKKLIKNVEEH